jgi:hypothetical protein
VPEDSVRPETQTLVILIRRKGFVGSLKFLMFKINLALRFASFYLFKTKMRGEGSVFIDIIVKFKKIRA